MGFIKNQDLLFVSNKFSCILVLKETSDKLLLVECFFLKEEMNLENLTETI